MFHLDLCLTYLLIKARSGQADPRRRDICILSCGTRQRLYILDGIYQKERIGTSDNMQNCI